MKQCPHCNRSIDLGTVEHLHDGEVIGCGGCGTKIEIVFLQGGDYVLDYIDRYEWDEQTYVDDHEFDLGCGG